MTHRLELGAVHLPRIAADQMFAVGFIPCGMGAFGLLGREARDLADPFPLAPRCDIEDDAHFASPKKNRPVGLGAVGTSDPILPQNARRR